MMGVNTVRAIASALQTIVFLALAVSSAQAGTVGDIVREIERHPRIYGTHNLQICHAPGVANVVLPAPNLDQALSQLPPQLRSVDGLLRTVYSVTNYGGRTTDSGANRGWRLFAIDTVLSDPQMFRNVFTFYRRLHARAEQASSNGQGANYGTRIENRSQINVFNEALEASGFNPERALTLLAIFGHDNIANNLTPDSYNDCLEQVLEILNRVRPTSIDLVSPYIPGALNGLGYSNEYIARGQQIARNCAALSNQYARNLCNDNLPSGIYMADYYHVIASAFLGCRSATENAAIDNFGLNNIALRAARTFLGGDENIYLAMVGVYKLNRFEDSVALLQFHLEPLSFYPLLQFALGRLRECTPYYEAFRGYERNFQAPGLSDLRFTPCTEPVLGPLVGNRVQGFERPVSADDYATVRAIIDRYQFEMEFRQYQHRMGLRFGMEQCRNAPSCRN